MSVLSLQYEGVGSAWIKGLAASLPASVRLVDQGGDWLLVGGQGLGDVPVPGVAIGARRVLLVDPQLSGMAQLGCSPCAVAKHGR
jgi:hypothetical protein